MAASIHFIKAIISGTSTTLFSSRNKILSSENGGIKPNQNLDSLTFNDPHALAVKVGDNIGQTPRSIFGSSIIAGTQYNEVMLLMRQSYDFGQKDSLVTDSVTYKLFYPSFQVAALQCNIQKASMSIMIICLLILILQV